MVFPKIVKGSGLHSDGFSAAARVTASGERMVSFEGARQFFFTALQPCRVDPVMTKNVLG